MKFSHGSYFRILPLTILIYIFPNADGQFFINQLKGANLHALSTAVPFLEFAPDGRSAGMGEAGAATSPDLNSLHWNPAKYAHIKGKSGISLSYTPWLPKLIPNLHLAYLSGYYRINGKNVVSGSFRYFSLNKMWQIGSGVWPTIPYYQYEFALDGGYSRLFTDHFSGGIVLRYIYSNLFDPHSPYYMQIGKSIAGDLGLYYQNDLLIGKKDAAWALGLNISNIGTPVSYHEDRNGQPIPTNLRIGGRFTFHFSKEHTLSLHADANKLMVPTYPEYGRDSITGNIIFMHGKKIPESVIRGMFQSFYDAPGFVKEDGSRSIFLEEMHEIAFSFGAEYWYQNQFAFRFGYFHEHLTKGGRQFFTAGIGGKLSFLTLDLSYLIPREGKNSPLFNTFRVSLRTEFGR